MKSAFEGLPRNMLQRDEFQGRLDFFYGRYLGIFPKAGLADGQIREGHKWREAYRAM